MHHSYSSKKGDPLCPLGFHPQVRWPTRCKRCFRDYKEHGDRKGSLTDIASSSPSLASWNVSPSLSSSGRSSDSGDYSKRNWASATNLAGKDEYGKRGYEKENTAPVSTSLLDLSSHARDEQSGRTNQPQKLQIKGVINSSSVGNSENDVAFIIQVRKSRQTSDKTENSNVQNDRDRHADREKDNTVAEKKNVDDKSEVVRLKSMLNEMKARCEKAEKEKSEILLRRLATMDTISSKTSANEANKLQKLTKELQAKNEALTEEKARLLMKITNLEEEANTKFHRNERDKVNNELRSKLRAAETLCESLMDENEDMKREIRELEEEIYELQDNFREEQADEYTSLRKSLEQSNKNCRILSFKLRKVERRAETLETERADLKRKCDEMSALEETVKKIRREYETKGQQRKGSDLLTKVQLKKILDDFTKELGNALEGLDGGKATKNVDNRDIRTEGANYEELSKEYEQLKEKLENTINELAKEREKKGEKTSRAGDDDDKKSKELISLRKRLEEAESLRDAERQDWEKEKTNHYEEKEKLKSKLLSLSAEKLKVYNEVLQLNKDLETAKAAEKERAKIENKSSELKEELLAERQKVKKLQEDLASSNEREKGMKEKLSTLERAKTKLESNTEGLTRELENTKTSLNEKIIELNGELTKVKKEKEKLKLQVDKEKKSKETEVAALKKKITALEKTDLNSRRIDEVKQSYNEKIQDLENEIKAEKEKGETLTKELNKMKQIKERFEKEIETLKSQLSAEEKKANSAETGQKNAETILRSKEEKWRTERAAFEERLRGRDAADADKRSINEANEKIDKLTRENKYLVEQMEEARRLHDDLSNKLKDYDAVSKVQNSLSADTSALEAEIKKLKTTLAEAEKTRKADLAQCKLRYEHRITAINDELQAIQNQLSRHKRERDTYKHMLEGAQKQIAEFKNVKRKQTQQVAGPGGNSSFEKEEDDSSTYVAILEKQISCMEDELSETRLEASSAKAELVSEKSAAHIKLSEMQSKINELEEERMLNNRRSKIPGLKVRMELAWQKEREEQQRLLQETATLARDLRQTLFEIERERVNERVEYKRKHDQLKKVLDEEKEENKKKLVELQCDLLELRDAHAKLRTSNEKMRREKERHEKEREDLKNVIIRRNKLEQSEMRNVDALLQLVENLLKLFPEFSRENGNAGPDDYTPTPPRRLKGPKSRESSPMIDSKDFKGSNSMLEDRAEKLKSTVDRLREVARELEESKRGLDEARLTRLKKFGKRSTSVDTSEPGKVIISTHSKTRLKRKSISLEQTSGRHEESPFIWSTQSNVSSMQSLEGSETGSQTFSLQRDSSVDSRLSGGSTKSEMLPREKRYGKSIIRKLTTKLTKSASFDDPQGPVGYGYQSSGSEVSVSEAVAGSRTEKKNLKKKLTDMFKRSSSSSSSKAGTATPTASTLDSRSGRR